MSGSHQTGQAFEWVEFDGERYELLAGSLIYRSPQVAFEGGVVLGDPSRRTDRRTVNVVLADTSEGMGQEAYTESQGLTTFTEASLDTRFGTPVARPGRTQLGTLPASLRTPPVHLEYLGLPNCDLLAWGYGPDGTAARWTGAAWVDLEAKAGYTAFLRFDGTYVTVRNNGDTTKSGVATSPDGVVWTDVPLIAPRTVAGVGGIATAERFVGGVVHDDKFYSFSRTDSAIHYNSTLGQASTLRITERLHLQPGESVVHLAEWRYDDAPTVYVVTTRRVLFLDDLTDTFHQYLDLWPYLAGSITTPIPWLTPHSDGNAYLTLYTANATDTYRDAVIQLTGNTYANVGPGIRGGTPYLRRFGLLFLVSGLNYLFGFAAPYGFVYTGGSRTLAMGRNLGWHTLYNEPSGTRDVIGGGYATGRLYTACNDGAVYRQSYAVDTTTLPANVGGDTGDYDTTAQTIDYAWTDLGIDEPIVIRDIEVDARVLRAPGVPVGTFVAVYYAINGTQDWTFLAQMNQTFPFPARLALGGGAGLACEEFRVRLVLGATATASPIIAKVVIHGLPAPDVRDVYSGQLDLGGDELDTPFGRRRSVLRDKLDALGRKRTFVRLSYGYGTWAATLASVRVSVTAREDPQTGRLLATFTALDYSTPPSGTTY